MVNDPITKIMRDASEIVRYDEVGIPLSIREGLLSAYPNHRALCHWHEDIEWVYIRSGQMNYYMNGKRVLLNTGEALMVNSRQMHYGYSENGQDCDFIRILCHPKIFITNSVLYQSYIAPVLSNPSLEYLHLKPEFPEDAEALQLLPEILRIKKEHPAAYEIEAAALLSLLWCRLLRSHPMMPNERPQNRRSRIFSYSVIWCLIFTATTASPSISTKLRPPEKSAATSAVRFSAVI